MTNYRKHLWLIIEKITNYNFSQYLIAITYIFNDVFEKNSNKNPIIVYTFTCIYILMIKIVIFENGNFFKYMHIRISHIYTLKFK